MTPKLFVSRFYPDAMAVQNENGISAVFTLAQAAVESAWGDIAPGNMFFGEKDTDGLNGNEQLLTTTEYSRKANAPFPNIISVTPVIRNGEKWFKYKIKAYFKKYATPADCFREHNKFLLENPRYKNTLAFKNDPVKFAEAIAAAGYATDPNYKNTLDSVIAIIEKVVGTK